MSDNPNDMSENDPTLDPTEGADDGDVETRSGTGCVEPDNSDDSPDPACTPDGAERMNPSGTAGCVEPTHPT